MWREVLFAIISTFGFGIIFNIRGKNLIFASLGGGLAWLIYKLRLSNENSVIEAMFISSIIFSAYSEICARVLKTPVTTFVICALIPLVPGGGMYNTMYATVQGNIDSALELGLNTMAQAGTLAIGIILVSTITRLMTSYKKKFKYHTK